MTDEYITRQFANNGMKKKKRQKNMYFNVLSYFLYL